MRHPSDLNLFTQPSAKLEIIHEQPTISDLKDWRKGDLLDLLELVCAIVKSDQYQNDPQMILDQAHAIPLPTTLATLLLNTLPRLERLLRVQHDTEFKVDGSGLPNCAELAKWIGLGGVFTRELQAILKPVEPRMEETAPTPQPVTEAPAKAVESLSMTEAQYSTLCITTNKHGMEGRQWKIAGNLIAEVTQVNGLGFVGKLYSGDHVTPLKPYRDYEPAATQCRAHAEGVLKLLKTIPR